MLILKLITWFAVIVTIVSFIVLLLEQKGRNPIKQLGSAQLIFITIFSAIIGSVLGYIEYRSDPAYKVFSNREIQASKLIYGEIGIELAKYHTLVADLKEYAELYSLSMQDSILASIDILNHIHHNLAKLSNTKYIRNNLEQQFSLLSNTTIPVSEINLFYKALETNTSEIKDYYELAQRWTPENLGVDLSRKLNHLYFETLSSSSAMLYYDYLGLLAQAPSEIQDQFNLELSPMLTSFPSTKVLTLTEAEALSTKEYNKQIELMNDLAGLIALGDAKQREIEENFESIVLKQEKNELLKSELDIKKQQLKDAYSRIYEKNKISKEEDQWTMFGKITKISALKMYKEAIGELDKFILYNKDKDPNVEEYSRSIQQYYAFLDTYKQNNEPYPTILDMPINKLGLIAMMMKDNKQHSCLKVGDIIITKNKTPIYDQDQFFALKTGEEVEYTIFRASNLPENPFMELKSKKGDPLILLANVFQKID